MKQLRHVREEQEQKIHDVILKKTKEWDKIRTDLESRVADATNELCEALAENQNLSRSLQERAKNMAELSGIKARVESDCTALQARLASLEKENARLKYEIHVLSKDIEIRNEECQHAKTAEEAAKKQNSERLKKIVKLEEECQKFRLLVKKRQPSPAPMSYVRGEVEHATNESIRRRSPCRRSTTSLPIKMSELSGNDFFADGGHREGNNTLSNQLLALQDEAKFLKESLIKKDDELKSARLMCARTANKLLNAEKQLDNYSSCGTTKSGSNISFLRQSNGGSVDLSIESVSGESAQEDACAESWATALIAELAHIKSDSKTDSCDAVQSCTSLDLMDDFAEMEKLASLSSPARDPKKSERLLNLTPQTGIEKLTCPKSAECSNRLTHKSTDDLCNELRDKLSAAEDSLHVMQEKQSASDATINQLRKILAFKFGLTVEGEAFDKAIEAAEFAIEAQRNNGDILARTQLEEDCPWQPNFGSYVEKSHDGTSETDFFSLGADLARSVRKVLEIVETIGQTDYSCPYAEWISTPSVENDSADDFSSPGKQWRSSGLDACVESLTNLCDTLVHGKMDIIEFIAEVASALDWLVGLIFTPPDKTSSERNNTPTGKRNRVKQCDTSDSEVISAESSPSQSISHLNDGDDAKLAETHDVLPDQSSVSNLSFQFSESSVADEETHRTDELTLKLSLEAEIRKATRYESEILRLKVVNEQLEQNHERAIRKLADLEAQLVEADENIKTLSHKLSESQIQSSNLEAQLQDLLRIKESSEVIVAGLEDSKSVLESEIHAARENINILEMKVLGLDEGLTREIKHRKEAEERLFELKELQKHRQDDRTMLEPSQSSNFVDDDTRLKKEQEIAAAAEKLAQCQQTIFDLGKQLKALGVPTNVSNKPPSEVPHDVLFSEAQTSSVNAVSDTYGDSDSLAVSASSSREKDTPHDHGEKISKNAGHTTQGEPATPAGKRGGNLSGKYGRHMPFDMHNSLRNSNRYPSPTRGDKDGHYPAASSHSLEAGVNSPLRSPARFLSLRSKNVHESSKHHLSDSEPMEKHGSSGLSRFFARTKGGH
ncbi:hypothetical protein KP509_39G017600 [Ceratopteris richardii]|nr:hypothetical protein KP509_39G017600 [Ceratopteris richardii]